MTFMEYLKSLAHVPKRPRRPRPSVGDKIFAFEFGGIMMVGGGIGLTIWVHLAFISLIVGGVFSIIYAQYLKQERLFNG